MTISAGKGLEIEGLDDVRAKIARLDNPAEFFDEQVLETQVYALAKLIKETNFDKLSKLDHTKNMWKAKKLEDSLYQIDNIKTSQDGKHSIAAIINYGRPEVRPVKAKRLYIPLSSKAKTRAKPYGAPIPNDFEYGWDKDYIFAKKSKAVKGTRFIQDTEEKAEKLLVDKVVKKIRGEFK